MELRRIKLIKNIDGHSSMNYKISLPKTWIDKMGNPEKVLLEFNKNSIIIKEDNHMLLIKEKRIENSLGHLIDFLLEDGTELYQVDWNGELYGNGFKNGKDTNRAYRPVYRFENENINLDDLVENSDEYIKASEIIGFEEI